MCALVVALKAVVEMALLFYLAQCVTWLLSFGRHDHNPVYRGLRFLTSPLTAIGRRLAPATAPARYASLLGLVAGLALWTAMVLAKASLRCVPLP